MLRKVLPFLSVFALPFSAHASNQVYLFQGAQQSVSETLTNPYSLDTISVNGTYNVNVGTYTGTGSLNTLLMTNNTDLLTLDLGGVQALSNIQQLVTGDGDDIVDLASANFSLGNVIVFGGSGNQTIWLSAGNDTINLGQGNDIVNAGPGNDYISVGSPAGYHDIIDGGSGVNTAAFGGNFSSYSITRTGPASFAIVAGGSLYDVSNVQFAQFSDQTVDLSTVAPVPAPASLWLMASGLAWLWMFGRAKYSGGLVWHFCPSPPYGPGRRPGACIPKPRCEPGASTGRRF